MVNGRRSARRDQPHRDVARSDDAIISLPGNLQFDELLDNGRARPGAIGDEITVPPRRRKAASASVAAVKDSRPLCTTPQMSLSTTS